MKPRHLIPASVAALVFLGGACSGNTGAQPVSSGGTGQQSSGGAGGVGSGSGGSGTGGATGTGGTVSAGGSPGTGGLNGSGGASSAGGAATGGSSGSGGATANTRAGGASAGGAAGGVAAGKGGSTALGGTTGGSTTSVVGGGPCDIYESAKTPCVGAYSTVRALYKGYSGNLYQVRSKSNKSSVKDIPLLEAGGYANSKVQDDFCTDGCTISILYDQSPQKNDMPVSGVTFWLKSGGTETDATAAKITVGGHAVYGVKSFGGKGNSYRAMKPKGTATGDQAEAMYEVVDSKFYNGSCCNDFGNAETTGNPDGAATMEAIYWGNCTMFGSGGGADKKGPWLLADLEAGTFGGEQANNPNNMPIITPAFATLMLKGWAGTAAPGGRWALKGGDAQTGTLTTKYDGKRPAGYNPMKKQGAIVLGAGGDGSFYSQGTFFEGAITIGCPDDDSVDDAIQANVVAAGYGK